MTQKRFKKFVNEIYSKGSKQNYITNKTNAFHIDDILSLDILNLKDYGPENNRFYRYVFVVADISKKIGWTVPFKNKNPQTKEESFENVLTTSKRKPKLI